jgi:hypothetical protein
MLLWPSETMRPEIAAAVLRRGNHRCAWCACALNTGRTADQSTVCKLDVLENNSSFVASCLSCAAEYSRWWNYAFAYSVDNAKRILGRDGALASGPFVEYLERVCGFHDVFAGRAVDKRKGLLTPFTTALARIEAQRNLPLDLRRTRAA